MKTFAQDYTTSMSWSWDSNPGRTILEPTALIAKLKLGFDPRFSSVCKMMKRTAKLAYVLEQHLNG